MISRLKIKNFRCFNTFETEIFPVTLISGENNSGKSTILESCFLLHGYQSPDSFLKISSLRDWGMFHMSPQFLWEPLFNNMQTSIPMEIAIVDEQGEKSIAFRRDNDGNSKTSVPDANRRNGGLPPLQNPLFDNYPLKYAFQSTDHSEEGAYTISENNLTRNAQSPSSEKRLRSVRYIAPHVSGSPSLVELLGTAELAGKKKDIVDKLRMLDGRIADLSTIVFIGIPTLYVQTVEGHKFPLRIMGDGMNRLLGVLLAIITNPGGILLIDEVENGFHYSFYEKFWSLLCALARENNCQVIATTHSYECIAGALGGATKAEAADDLGYIRLARTDDNISAKVFTTDMLAIALESEMEIR